jgi:hypothetical protein
MKQSILKKPTQLFKDNSSFNDSSFSQIASNLTLIENSRLQLGAAVSAATKNVRFLGVDLVQSADFDGTESTSALAESTTSVGNGFAGNHDSSLASPRGDDYISFQKSSSSSSTSGVNSLPVTTVYRNYHRKSKTLPLRQINIFPSKSEDESDQLTVYAQQQQQSLANKTNSEKSNQQQQQQSQQQYEMLRRTLRISSASLANKTVAASNGGNPFTKNSIGK